MKKEKATALKKNDVFAQYGLDGILPNEWAIAFVIAFVLSVPLVAMLAGSAGPAFFLTTTLSALIAKFLKEKRTKTSPEFSPFQKMVLAILAIVVLFNIVAIALFVLL
ncbi:MAG: hypothetical protein ABH854_04590 [Candidatus Diapherotrites archaeon]